MESVTHGDQCRLWGRERRAATGFDPAGVEEMVAHAGSRPSGGFGRRQMVGVMVEGEDDEVAMSGGWSEKG